MMHAARNKIQAFEHWNEELDQRMLAELARSEFHSLKIREKVASALMARFKLLAMDKAAHSAAICAWRFPHFPERYRSSWKTADAIWQACGDQSVGFDYYSKRTLLSLVSAFSFRAWLSDTTADMSRTRSAVDKYIQKVMQIQTAKWKAKQFFARLSLKLKS